MPRRNFWLAGLVAVALAAPAVASAQQVKPSPAVTSYDSFLAEKLREVLRKVQSEVARRDVRVRAELRERTRAVVLEQLRQRDEDQPIPIVNKRF